VSLQQNAILLSGFEFLTKPVDFDELKAQLQQLPSGAAGEVAPAGSAALGFSAWNWPPYSRRAS